MSPDPAGAGDGLNLYAFIGGNPVSSVDDGGLEQGGLSRHNSDLPLNGDGGLVARRIAFFERLAQGTATRDIPTGIVAQRAARFERLADIPQGLVGRRVAAFEGRGRDTSTRDIPAGLVAQRRTQFERLAEIPQGIVARRVAAFEGAARGGPTGDAPSGLVADRVAFFEGLSRNRNNPPPPPRPVVPDNASAVQGNNPADKPDNRRERSKSEPTPVRTSYKISVGTDINTAVLIAAAILIATRLIENEIASQRLDKLRAEDRASRPEIQRLNEAIRSQASGQIEGAGDGGGAQQEQEAAASANLRTAAASAERQRRHTI